MKLQSLQWQNHISSKSITDHLDNLFPIVTVHRLGKKEKRDNIPLKPGKLNPVLDMEFQRYVYVENNKGTPCLWKRVEDQELGGNVRLYGFF